MHKKIFLNTAYQVIGKVIISGLAVISTAFLSRYLGVNKFGEYSFIFAFVGLASVFPDFGLGTLATREIAAKRAGKNYFNQIFTLRVLLSVLALIVLLPIVVFYPFSAPIKLGILIAYCGNIFLLVSSIIWSVFQAELKFQKTVIAQVITAVISMVLIVLAVILRLPFIFFIIVTAISAIAGLIVSLRYLHFKIHLSLDFQVFKELIKKSFPLSVGLILSTAYFKIDSLILSYYFNPGNFPFVGLYSMAYRIFEVFIVFAGFFLQTLFPHFSSNLGKKAFLSSFKRFFIYSVLISAAVMLAMIIFSGPFVIFLGGSEYVQSVGAVSILSLAAFSTILGGFFYTVAVAAHKQVLLAKLAVIALLINVILNIIYIPTGTYIAASWITVLTQGFILIVNGLVVFRVVKSKLATTE